MQLELLNEQGQATSKVEAPDTVFARDYNEALVHQIVVAFQANARLGTRAQLDRAMGNGKGNPEYYVAEIQPGKVLYEINGIPEALAREAFLLAAAKLPLKTTFVVRQLGH